MKWLGSFRWVSTHKFLGEHVCKLGGGRPEEGVKKSELSVAVLIKIELIKPPCYVDTTCRCKFVHEGMGALM